MTDTVQSSVVPFCIYHKDYIAYVASSRVVINEKNKKYELKCDNKSMLYDESNLYSTFYAISPALRPIPLFTNIFCIKHNEGDPYNIIDIKAMEDIFDLTDNSIYFIAYSQPTLNTVPLYLHQNGRGLFPSFNIESPTNNGWTQHYFSPIFVMTAESTSKDFRNIKFKYINSRCIPWTHDIPDIYDINHKPDLLNLEDCLVYNELNISGLEGRPDNILEMVKKQNISTNNFSKTSNNIKNIQGLYIGIIIAIFTIAIIIIIFLCVKSYNKNTKRYGK